MDCQIYLEAEKQEQDICLQPEAYNQASGGTIEITENGTYDVTKYQEAEVDVPLPQGQIDITQNGVVNVYDYAEANVNVMPNPMDYFNFTVDPEAVGASSVQNWWKAGLVRWDNLPTTPTFQIAQSVTSLASFFQETNIIKAKLVGGGNVTSMNQFAYEVDTLQEIDLSGLDMSSVTSMYNAFSDCINLRTVNINQETPNLTRANYTFQGCDSIESADFSSWKAENLTNVEGLFFLAQLNHIDIDLSGWRTTKVTDMSSAFRTDSGEGARYINISGWTTESLTNNSMIFQAPGIEAIVIDSPSVFRLTSNNAFQYNRHPSVYVPDNLVDEYKSATNWTTVADQIKPLSELPQEVKDVFNM